MKIITSKPECVWKSKTLLGEGTLWVKSLNSIFFVDIKKKKIFILNTKNQRKRIVKVNKEIGFLSHVKKSIFILGLKGELRIVDLKTKKMAIFLSCVVCFQFLLGIVTLINMVPVHLGALHQTGALILFIGFTISMHRNNMDVKTN